MLHTHTARLRSHYLDLFSEFCPYIFYFLLDISNWRCCTAPKVFLHIVNWEYASLSDSFASTEKIKYEMYLVTQLCLTLCDPMDCSPPGSSVHGDSPGKNTGVGWHALLQGEYGIGIQNFGLKFIVFCYLVFDNCNRQKRYFTIISISNTRKCFTGYIYKIIK